jgi:DNA polymerase-3 subunit alpha
MAFAQLEDLEGSFELVIFSDVYEEYVGVLREARDEGTGEGERGPVPLVVQGTLEEGDPPKILVRKVTRLSEAEEKLTASVRVRVRSPEVTRDRLLALKRLLGSHAGDCGVFLHITIPGESETILGVGGIRGVAATAELCRDVDRLFGRPVAERAL